MDIIESFLNAQSKTEVLETLKKYCNDSGFDNFIYTPLLVGGDSVQVFKDESRVLGIEALIGQNIISNFSDSWARRYQEAQHVSKDPIIKHISKSILPIFWDDAVRADPKNIVMGEAKEHGLGDGVTVSLYGHGGDRAVLSFARQRSQYSSQTEKLVSAGLAQLTANYVHEALWRLSSTENKMYPALSVRERDCLQWAAIGKTSWEIAQILSISERTVIFHLTNATKKLDATNRRQAVVRALSLRLINP
jgi:DNA-binding CsgD family transcriptional regulator